MYKYKNLICFGYLNLKRIGKLNDLDDLRLIKIIYIFIFMNKYFKIIILLY